MFTVIRKIALGWLLCLLFLPMAGAEPAPAIPRLILGVYLPSLSNEANLSDIKLTLEYWIVEISKQFQVMDAHAEFFEDIDQLRQAFMEKRLDMVIAPPLEFVRRFDRNQLADGITGTVDTDGQSSLALLARKDEIADFKALKGKKLLLPEGDELAKLYIETLSLRHAQIPSRVYFSSTASKKKNDSLILDLFFKQVDAVVVYRNFFEVMAEMNPQIRKQIAIVETYPLKTRNFAFFRKDYEFAERIFPTLDKFEASPRGQQILQMFRSDRIAKSYVTDLQPIVDLYNEYLRLSHAKP